MLLDHVEGYKFRVYVFGQGLTLDEPISHLNDTDGHQDARKSLINYTLSPVVKSNSACHKSSDRNNCKENDKLDVASGVWSFFD